MPHRAVRQEGSEAGRVPAAPGPRSRRVPRDASPDPTPTHRPRRSQLHTKAQCGEADQQETAGKHGGKRTKTGRRREQRLAPRRTARSHASPQPRPTAHGPPPANPSAQPAPPPGRASPGIHCPAALPLPPVYYAGRDCKRLRAFIPRWGIGWRDMSWAEEVKDGWFIGPGRQ